MGARFATSFAEGLLPDGVKKPGPRPALKVPGYISFGSLLKQAHAAPALAMGSDGIRFDDARVRFSGLRRDGARRSSAVRSRGGTRSA
jgi:hypothetical protein